MMGVANSTNYRAGTTPAGNSRIATTPKEPDDTETPDGEEDESAAEKKEPDTSGADENKEADGKDDEVIAVDKLPDDLKPLGKRMQAAVTKARQKDAASVKEFKEELATKYAQAVQRSNMLQDLSAHEHFKLMWDDLESGRPYGYSSKYRSNGKNEDSGDSDTDDTTPLDAKKIEAMIDKRARELMDRELAPQRRSQAEALVEKAKEKYGEVFTKNRPAVMDYLQKNPNSNLDQGMWAVAGEELTAARIAKAMAEANEDGKELSGKKLRTEKPSAVGGGESTPSKAKKYGKVSEALSDSMKELFSQRS